MLQRTDFSKNYFFINYIACWLLHQDFTSE